MVVIAGDASILGLGRRDASAEVDRLYRRHADEVLRYVLAVLRSRPDAEDVVQATFIRAFRALARGERVQKPRHWLIKIAHNECRRALAARSRRAIEVELDEVPATQGETGGAESLRAALCQLAPSQRDALVLRELEGRTYAEIAETLDVSEAAVETLLFRARRAVREQLEEPLDCPSARTLIAQEELGEQERRRLRAHARACAACAHAERQARGQKGALRRLASSIGLPGFGKGLVAKVLAVTATASAVGVTGAVIAERPAAPGPLPAALQDGRSQLSPVVGARHAAAQAGARRRVATHPGVLPDGVRPSSVHPERRTVRRRAAAPPDPRHAATTAAPSARSAPARPTETAAPPPVQAAPKVAPRILPLPTLPAAAAVGALPLPEAAQLPVPQLPVPAPAVDPPAVTLPSVDPASLPADVAAATPQVIALPGVP